MGTAVTGDDDLAIDESTSGSADSDDTPGRRRLWRMRWVFTRRLCFGGLAGGLVFFCLSMTPSLLPRAAIMQGVVSGVAVAIGYGFGSLLSSILRKLIRREPSDTFKHRAWWVLAGSTLAMGGLFLYYGADWQDDVRTAMEMEGLRATEWFLIVVLTVVVSAFILMVARFIRGGTRALIRLGDRFFPHHVTVNVSIVAVTLLVVGFTQGVLFDGMISSINSAYSLTDRGTSPWISQPESELRSGGSNSVVDWDSLGTKGRDFTGEGGGPTAAEIEAFTRTEAMEPIRVYVGLESADDTRDRVALAMAELERTNAFDRSVLVVNTTTGTGWVDENVVDSIEFLHGGDTAQVAMQYSYLPSWVSFLVDRSKAAEAGEQMITAIDDRVSSMSPEDRPTLLVFGESLGSFGTESAFTSPENLLANVDGALLVGPTFVNPLHTLLVDERDEGSPSWRPIVNGGESFRFAVDPADLTDPELLDDPDDWSQPRGVYLQNSSDPITYFNPALLWSKPSWLEGERGPDINPDMVWVPAVSFFQVAADMAFSMDVPAGHGHRYGSNVVDGWVQLESPEGWTPDDTAALRELIDERAEERQRKEGSCRLTDQGASLTEPCSASVALKTIIGCEAGSARALQGSYGAQMTERPTEPRITPIDLAADDVDPELSEILSGSLTHDGTPLNIFGALAQHPKLLKRFNLLGGFLLNKGILPPRERELVILRIGWNAQAKYEFGQHTIIGRQAGLTDDEITAVTKTSDAHGWSNDDAAPIAMSDELAGDDCVTDATWSRLAARWSEPELVELLIVAGFYRLVSGFLNSAGVQLDNGVPGFPSPT